MNFGNRLVQVREYLGFNQVVFSDKLGLAAQSLVRYEKNKITPSIDFLKKLTEMFSINSNWLLTGDGEMFLNETTIKNQSNHHFSEKEIEMCNNYRELDEDDQEIFYLELKVTAAKARKKRKD